MPGRRGPVAFMLQVTYFRPGATERADQTDLTARAEALARQAVADWSAWLGAQLAS